MFIMNDRMIRDRKINQLRNGVSAYAESQELIRLIKRDILKYNMNVYCDENQNGCLFIPLQESNGVIS